MCLKHPRRRRILESRIYHQAIGNKQVRSHRNIRLALMIFILAGFVVLYQNHIKIVIHT